MENINLLEIDNFVETFLQDNKTGIYNIHRTWFKTDNQLSLSALNLNLKEELRTGCVSFVNKHSSLEGLSPYLFYIVNAYCKQQASSVVKKKLIHICPGCLFMGQMTTLSSDKFFHCHECQSKLDDATNPKDALFYGTFAVHNKNGYRCPDCKRFIPHPLNNAPILSCPYFDCCFVGEYSNLDRMHHTTSKSNLEYLALDDDGAYNTQNIPNDIGNPSMLLEQKENLKSKIKVLQEVIDSQSSCLSYSSSDFTLKHKQLVYQAFSSYLKKSPEEMVEYLLEKSRSGGFQHKVFQEYIRLLENSLPFLIKKGNKHYRIDNLLSEHLCIFNGISVFDSIVSPKLDIKNGTKEFYIGGRKSVCAQPYYIGKILGIIHAETKEPILHLVKEYSFSKIKMKDITPGVPVIVTHLRIPPHYQMGGMVYVNRIRKKIIDRAQELLTHV